jgi:hypothetical protein
MLLSYVISHLPTMWYLCSPREESDMFRDNLELLTHICLRGKHARQVGDDGELLVLT